MASRKRGRRRRPATRRKRKATFEEARRQTERLETEIATLVKFLRVEAQDSWPPLVDALTVKHGYEKALGAALGDELAAPTDEAAPVHWRSLPPLDATAALPEGAAPLCDFVTAPQEPRSPSQACRSGRRTPSVRNCRAGSNPGNVW